jgi:hypothetical protein
MPVPLGFFLFLSLVVLPLIGRGERKIDNLATVFRSCGSQDLCTWLNSNKGTKTPIGLSFLALLVSFKMLTLWTAS